MTLSHSRQRRLLYLDHCASSPLRPEARRAMLEWLDAANPSSLHGPGRLARAALTRARRTVAELVGAPRDAVVFTGNGSEANLLALQGVLGVRPSERRHVLASRIEHPSVLDPLRALASRGEVDLEELEVDPEGRVAPDQVASRLRAETALVSVMLASNEIGTLQPIPQIARRLRPHGILLHCDACQGPGRVAVDLAALECDLLTLSAHKFGGPHGVGILVRRPELVLHTPLSPDRQEGGLRGGTEDVAACVGAAAALEAARAELPESSRSLRALGRDLVRGLRTLDAAVVVHSPERDCLPGLVNFSIAGIPGAWLVAALDRLDVAVSHGSACSSRAALPSPVLEAIGAAEYARSSVRVSMGRGFGDDDLRDLLTRLRQVVVEMKESSTFASVSKTPQPPAPPRPSPGVAERFSNTPPDESVDGLP